ncbi:hypothetical protein BASA81_012539 [Batrachochytrium salamandrivorans]|nr:hypothetical protein BASA81_012539 [Batrachochytrium salamandrivorans]
MLINNCPELASLEVYFKQHSAFDFVSSVLEHPSNKVKVLEMPPNTEGDSARFFAALGRSQVSALALYYSPEVAQGLHEYLARDLLVRLNSITTLTLDYCSFVGGFDWSFLADSNVRELGLDCGKGVDGNQLGDALAVHLGAKGLDELRLRDCRFADETLAVVGVELGRIKMLEIYSDLSDASIALIALALQSPNSEVKELRLWYDDNTVSSIETHLAPALSHPNCNLVRLSFLAYRPEHKKAAERVEDMFRKRLALFALLQGRQMRRLCCPLRRLPVEMFRLVGQMLN